MAGKFGELDFHRLQASSTAERAVSVDEAGLNSFEAAQLYDTAAKHLNHVLELTGPEISLEDRAAIEEKLLKYKKRSSILRTNMLAKELPDIPDKGSDISREHKSIKVISGNVISANEASKLNASTFVDSDVLKSAVAACEKARRIDEDYAVSASLCAVGSKVGSTAVAAIHTAGALEEEYHVSERVVDSVKYSVSSVQKIEEDYKVSERVVSAARDAARLASDYEARYQIQQKMAALACESWEAMKNMSAQAIEYDRRYQISERAGAAVMSGISSAAEMAREAANYYYSSSKPSEPVTALPPNAQV